MSLLFDQNLSRRLPALLGAIFPGSRQVIGAGLIGAEDKLVWEYAALHGLAIVTKDSDFRDMALTIGSPPKVIWLRIGNGPTRMVEGLIRMREPEIRSFLSGTKSILELP